MMMVDEQEEICGRWGLSRWVDAAGRVEEAGAAVPQAGGVPGVWRCRGASTAPVSQRSRSLDRRRRALESPLDVMRLLVSINRALKISLRGPQVFLSVGSYGCRHTLKDPVKVRFGDFRS